MSKVRAFVAKVGEVTWTAVKTIAGLSALLFVLWCSSDVTSPSNEEPAGQLEVISPDTTISVHSKVVESLRLLWYVSPGTRDSFQIGFVPSSEVNAASFGHGRFLVWEGVGKLPRQMIDGIMAHEIAHDVLRHSRDRRELDSVTGFAGEVLSLLLGGRPGSEDRMQRWVNKVVVPTYSRSQEVEADAHAITILEKAGYPHPDSVLAETLQVLLDRYGDTEEGFFNTHPPTSERINHILQDSTQ